MRRGFRKLVMVGLCTVAACGTQAPTTDLAQSSPLRTTEQAQASALGGMQRPMDGDNRATLETLQSKNGVEVTAGDITLRLTTTACKAFAGDIAICNQGNRLDIENAGSGFRQTLRPRSVFVDFDALVYDGPLSESGKPDTHTFTLSDVNGDGPDDLVIWSGREGAYGGPSFDVYIFDAAASRFQFNQPFSDLTVGYLGLFSVDGKEIKTASKSGCCIHVRETYTAEDGEPRIIERITEDATTEGSTRTIIERLVNGELREEKQ